MYCGARHVDTLSFIVGAYRGEYGDQGGCLYAECADLYYGPSANRPYEEPAGL